MNWMFYACSVFFLFFGGVQNVLDIRGYIQKNDFQAQQDNISM